MSYEEVPLAVPDLGEAEIAAVTEVLKSGWLAHGPWNHKFEEAFSHFLDVPHAVTMNSCTSALEVALKVHGIKGEVILPSMTWCASANSVVTTGGTPVFCEIDLETRNTTARLIQERLTPRTEAVMVVHFGGQPCAMSDIVALCNEKRLLLIEDSAETLGATWKGKQAGSFGVGCFSFFPTKNITTAEGGMLSCHDASIAQKVRALIAHGVSSTTFAREKQTRPWIRAAEMAGHNFRMPNPLAALGYHQLARLNDMNERRRKLAARYDVSLKRFEKYLEVPKVIDGATHAYQMYTLRVKAPLRNAFVMGLREQKVGASVHFDPPVHLQPYYLERGCQKGDLPLTEQLADELVTLPMFPTMTLVQQDRVIDAIGVVLNKITGESI